MIKLLLPLLLLASCTTTETTCKEEQLVICSGVFFDECEPILDAETSDPVFCQ